MAECVLRSYSRTLFFLIGEMLFASGVRPELACTEAEQHTVMWLAIFVFPHCETGLAAIRLSCNILLYISSNYYQP
jgi:hypothetical protein